MGTPMVGPAVPDIGAPRVRHSRTYAGPSRPARARRAVVWGLGLFVAVNLGTGLVAEHYPRLRDPLFGDKLARLRPRAAGDRPLVLVLGSSRTGLAFHGRRLEEQSEFAAFNFGVPASGPVTHRVYLRRLLASGVKPALLVVEVLPAMLHHDGAPPRESHWLFADRLTSSERATVIGHGFPARAVHKRWRESVLVPAYALRFQVLSRVSPSWLPWPLRFDWSRGADECGWGKLVDQAPAEADRAKRFAQTRAEYADTLAGFAPGGPAADALRELVADCRAAGVPVRLVLLPESGEFRSLYGPGANDRLREVLAGCGGPVTDARDWLPDEAFNDGHHMLVRGAERFTDRLLREVVEPALK